MRKVLRAMEFDQSFCQEEVRCDFLVTEKRKKVWYAELELLKKFDEVCQKYQLTYFAEYGTLLGAIRHHGFIPWDDDIDVIMFRDDYMKLQEVAATEFTDPYFFQTTYNDLIVWAFAKLRDSRTTAIEFTDMSPNYNQGIFIDIFPLDDAPDGINFSPNILTVQSDIWQTVVNSKRLRYYLAEGVQYHVDTDILADLLSLPVRERFRQFEEFNLNHFGISEKVNYIVHGICKYYNTRERSWYSDVEYVPFEYLTIPVPVGYDHILKQFYGDYHQFVRGGSSHNNLFLDPDKPYRYYMEHLDEVKPANLV